MSDKVEPSQVRAWALERGMSIGKRGRLSHELIKAYQQDMQRRETEHSNA